MGKEEESFHRVRASLPVHDEGCGIAVLRPLFFIVSVVFPPGGIENKKGHSTMSALLV